MDSLRRSDDEIALGFACNKGGQSNLQKKRDPEKELHSFIPTGSLNFSRLLVAMWSKKLVPTNLILNISLKAAVIELPYV